MATYKRVSVKGSYELVSYTHKDLVAYAIRTLGNADEVWEILEPHDDLKGWDLRRKAIEILESMSKKGSPDNFQISSTDTAVGSIYELQVGDVITYQNPSFRGERKFHKVYEMGQELVLCVNELGASTFWGYQSLDNHIRNQSFKVLRGKGIPEMVANLLPDKPVSLNGIGGSLK